MTVSSGLGTLTSLVMFSEYFFVSSDHSKKKLPVEFQKAKKILLFPKLTPWLSHHHVTGKNVEIKIYSNPYCEKKSGEESDRHFYIELASLDFLMPTHEYP